MTEIAGPGIGLGIGIMIDTINATLRSRAVPLRPLGCG